MGTDPRELLHIQEVDWDDAHVDALLRGARQKVRARTRRRIVLVAAVLAIGLTVGFSWLPRGGALPKHPVDTVAEVSPVSATPAPSAAEEPVPHEMVHFADGSVAQPLDDRSRLVIAEVSPERLIVDVEAGGGHFEVTPAAGRRFEVRASTVQVVVLGTIFDVELQDDQVWVGCEEGRVAVHGPGGEWELGPGQNGLFSTAAPRLQSQLAPPVSSWRELAEKGEFVEARALLEAAPQDVREDLEDQLLAADTLRLAGDPQRALEILDAALVEPVDDPHLPVAFFTRGRLLLQLAQWERASEDFHTVAEGSGDAALREDALAREVEALHHASRADEANTRATDYLERFPGGRRTRAVQRYGGPGGVESTP